MNKTTKVSGVLSSIHLWLGIIVIALAVVLANLLQ